MIITFQITLLIILYLSANTLLKEKIKDIRKMAKVVFFASLTAFIVSVILL